MCSTYIAIFGGKAASAVLNIFSIPRVNQLPGNSAANSKKQHGEALTISYCCESVGFW